MADDNESIGEGPSEIGTASTSSLTKINILDLLEQFGQDIKIVFVGRSGAGKSTLINNILGLSKDIDLSLDSTTQKCETKLATKKDITAHIVDTPGLQGEMIKQLRTLSKHTASQANIIVYCLPINPGAKFHAENSRIMQALQDTFGSAIWKHCIVILTFSNLALGHCNTMHIMDPIGKYKEHVNNSASRFKTELTESLNIRDVDVKTIFEEVTDEKKTTITAIPAGFIEGDEVLPGDPYEWKVKVFYELLKKCKDNGISDILRDKLLRNRINRAVKKYGDVAIGATGGGTGVVVGAGIGGVAGVVGGPAGVIVGGLVGASVGALAGVGFSAATAGVKSLRDEND